MNIPSDLHYTPDHEWIDGKGTVGITDYAQEALGDVVFVEIPQVGRKLTKGEAFGVVESVKSVSDLYSPTDGVVQAVNGVLLEHPELVNQDPYGQGWLVRLDNAAPSAEMLDAKAYEHQIEGD
jgi:glycine cleavage system H protein